MKIKISQVCYLAIIYIVTLTMQGCATEGKSIAFGGVLGAGTGAIMGGIVDPGKNGEYRTRNVMIGAAFGGMAGIATGALVHDSTESKKKEAYIEGQKSMEHRIAPPPSGPEVSAPRVEVQWVDGRVVGNRYIDGHYERVIAEPARWEVEGK